MGNCTSSDIKGQAIDSSKVQETRPVKRDLKELFDEKKGDSVHEAVRDLAEADAAPEAVGDASKVVEEPATEQVVEALADAVVDAAADAVSDTPESAASSEHQGIAALRRVSPRADGLSLLQAAGETPTDAAEPEAACGDAAAADAVATGDAEAEAEEAPEAEVEEAPTQENTTDAVVGDDAPQVRFASKLAVDTDAEPEAATTRELECESPASPSSPAAWVPDNSTKACQCCEADFTFVRRRHHCRACGQVVCSSCSTSRKVVADMGHTKPVRCCDRCVKAEH